MLFPLLCICFSISQLSKELYPATDPPSKPSLAFVFSHSSHDSLIDKKNSLALPPPILPLTHLHALFIGIFKSYSGHAWIVHRLKLGGVGGGLLSISLQRISPLHGPRPLGFYACMPGCKSECTMSQVDRAFIYSTLQVCRLLAVIAVTVLASVCLPLSPSPILCPIFQPGMLACATSSQGFGPLTGRLWGIRRGRTEKDEGERRISQSGALEGSTWCCLTENCAALSLITMRGYIQWGLTSYCKEDTVTKRKT